MNCISYKFLIKLRWQSIKSVHPVWNGHLNGHGGIDPVTAKRGYPLEYRRTPAEWLDSLITRRAIEGSHVITQTTRNWFQNLRTPLFCRETGICQQKDERVEQSQRPYYGFSFLDNGQLTPLAADFRKPFAKGVRAWAGGIPVLWDGKVLSLEQMAPEVCDFSHLWRLRTSKGSGDSAEDMDRFRRLDSVFRRYLHAGATEASAALCAEAKGLARENDYLHNAVGIGEEGIVVVLAHGSLEQIGQWAKQAGATHAVIVDNGGSCQIGLRPAGKAHRPLVESYYFREPSIAMMCYQLASGEDIIFEGSHDDERSTTPSSSIARAGDPAGYKTNYHVLLRGTFRRDGERVLLVTDGVTVKRIPLRLPHFLLLLVLASVARQEAGLDAPLKIRGGAFLDSKRILEEIAAIRPGERDLEERPDLTAEDIHQARWDIRRRLRTANLNPDLLESYPRAGSRISTPPENIHLTMFDEDGTMTWE